MQTVAEWSDGYLAKVFRRPGKRRAPAPTPTPHNSLSTPPSNDLPRAGMLPLEDIVVTGEESGILDPSSIDTSLNASYVPAEELEGMYEAPIRPIGAGEVEGGEEEKARETQRLVPADVLDENGRLDWKKLWAYDKAEFARQVWQRAPYYILPIAIWLPKYEWKKDFLSDLIAGIGVGCMLVPQGLAYSIIAGVPPVMGLYTALFPLLVFAIMTTSRHMHFGPDALAALLVGQIMLAPQYDGEDNQYLAPIFSFICGLTCLVMGIVRVGFLDNILSKPLLNGFVNAVASIIVTNQLESFLGLPPLHKEQAWEKLYAVAVNITSTHILTLVLGSSCLSILILIRVLKWRYDTVKWLKFLIDTVIVVAFGIIISFSFDLLDKGVKILGEFPSELPIPEFPRFKSLEKFQDYYVDAIVICVIGFVESIVVVKLYSTKYNYSVSPNRELVAMGTANLFGSFFRTFPAFGSLTRSAVGDFLGSKSQLFALVSGVVVLITILTLGPVIYFLPRVTMSAIIMVAAYSLIDLQEIRLLFRVKAWKEIALLITTFLITFILGVDTGIFVGVGISLLMVVAKTTVPRISILGMDKDGKWVDASKDKTASLSQETLVIRIEESLYFANISQIKEMFKRIELFGHHHAHPTSRRRTVSSTTQTAPSASTPDSPSIAPARLSESSDLKNIIIHCKYLGELDASAASSLHEMVREYDSRGIFLCFAKLKPTLFDQIRNASNSEGPLKEGGEPRVFSSVAHAYHYITHTRK